MPSAVTESVFFVPLNHFRCADVASLGCAEESADQLNLPTGLNRFIGDQSNQLLKVFNDSGIDSKDPSEETATVPDSIWSTGSAWPLVLFGPSGTGKTSLGLSFLSNLSKSVRTKRITQALPDDQQPGYITASDFDRRFRSAMETDSVIESRMKLAARSGLLIDNLNELASKPVAQHEIVQLIDIMVAKNRPILFTMVQSPYETTALIPQLASRLGLGLTLPVSPPGADARFEIIRDLAELHRLRFTNEAIGVLVDRLPVTVPGINHILIQFKLSLSQTERSLESLDGSPIDSDRVIQWLCADSASVEKIEKLIRKTVAAAFNIKVTDLSSQSRKQTAVLARGVAIWLNRQLTRTSFKKIGQQFGNRDHSTIMHAWRKIDALVNEDHRNHDNHRSTQQTILRLKQTLAQQVARQVSGNGKPVQAVSTNVSNQAVANNQTKIKR